MIITISQKNMSSKIIKFLLTVLLIYEEWYLEKYAVIPYFLQILAILIVGCTFLNSYRSLWTYFSNKTFVSWFMFGAVAALSALFFSTELSHVISSLVTYFSFLAMCFCAGAVTQKTRDLEWFRRAMLITACMCAFSAIFQGVDYKNGDYYVTTMSYRNNPNNLGLMMSIGVFFMLMPLKKQSVFAWIVRALLTVAFIYVIVNTGSRSSLLCSITVVGFSVFSRIKNTTGQRANRLLKQSILILACIGALLYVMNLAENYTETGTAISRLIEKLFHSSNTTGNLWNKLKEKFRSDEFSGRMDLYKLSWDIFLQRPIIGIGYNCFRVLSGYGYFTHSTYMELLSCTGIVGFFLFLGPVFSGLKYAIISIKRNQGRKIILLCVMLLSGFFGILYYNFVFMMVLYLIVFLKSELEETKQLEDKP